MIVNIQLLGKLRKHCTILKQYYYLNTNKNTRTFVCVKHLLYTSNCFFKQETPKFGSRRMSMKVPSEGEVVGKDVLDPRDGFSLLCAL